MPVYIITLGLKSDDYSLFYEALAQYEACRIHEHTWLLAAEEHAPELMACLASLLADQDSLFIAQITSNSAWHNTPAAGSLARRL